MLTQKFNGSLIKWGSRSFYQSNEIFRNKGNTHRRDSVICTFRQRNSIAFAKHRLKSCLVVNNQQATLTVCFLLLMLFRFDWIGCLLFFVTHACIPSKDIHIYIYIYWYGVFFFLSFFTKTKTSEIHQIEWMSAVVACGRALSRLVVVCQQWAHHNHMAGK